MSNIAKELGAALVISAAMELSPAAQVLASGNQLHEPPQGLDQPGSSLSLAEVRKSIEENRLQVWTKNLFEPQNYSPQITSVDCVAASAQIMLNIIKSQNPEDKSISWQKNTSAGRQLEMFRWIRQHDTLQGGVGSDPNGWANGLNEFGLGEYEDSERNLYAVKAYDTYHQAVKAAVMAIATLNMPVGIAGLEGKHAQFLTGFEAYGENPAESSDFRVLAVYLSDPLPADNMKNSKISNRNFRQGAYRESLRAYGEPDSPPYSDDWFGKFVLIIPVRRAVHEDPDKASDPISQPVTDYRF